MKLSRQKLIDTCESVIAATSEARLNAESDYSRAIEEHRQTYVETHRDAWIEFINNVKSAVVFGSRPVTVDDVPASLKRSGSGIDFYSPTWWRSDSAPGSRYNYPHKPDVSRYDTADYAALLAFLQSVTDDEVTSAGLERAGFRNVYALFRRAIRNEQQ